MEDLQSSKEVEIKSKIKNYSIVYLSSFRRQLNSIITPDDFILIDEVVEEKYFSGFDFGNRFISIKSTEKVKSYDYAGEIIEILIRKGIRRNNRLIAIGGGVIQDLTCFIASVLFRGIEWIYLPTTLLSQGDSCIGSKVSINFKGVKNLIGGFYPPAKVYVDPEFIETLPEDQIQSGIGEMLHYFIIDGENSLRIFEKNYLASMNNRSKESIRILIEKSLSIKKQYIEIDEFDKKERLIFNYGHSFGHAIESITNYSIPHGVAVAFGMDMANYFSTTYCNFKIKDYQRLNNTIRPICNGFSIRNIDIESLLTALSKDKKNRKGEFGLILLDSIGDLKQKFVTNDKRFFEKLKTYFETYDSRFS